MPLGTGHVAHQANNNRQQDPPHRPQAQRSPPFLFDFNRRDHREICGTSVQYGGKCGGGVGRAKDRAPGGTGGGLAAKPSHAA
eukprot:CAMPEP_0174349982 /NCGR_PEP_ID=MMETSP0811_2-20130205/6893_1 /TAXON_ID=73025 ORGANISM="Eutreptiella gymnastica-like, Strain CCMP1594" /NCGR_SAMPLE_ID=MMETSP0811_2 /ASSEMBLY_ACC=CAM_ASM_000667 /LENGTH=82 /DNA_ID=CAMNT_0015477829 /DNA_START=458 /DNA_END=702 /DNA_ORIENTATION=-